MGAKSVAARRAVAKQGAANPIKDPHTVVPEVGPREPCPCGSGRRYKGCHGKAAARAADAVVLRPFAGLPGEADWVALREIVPAATAELVLTGDYAGRTATLSTVLPMAWPAMVRLDGSTFLGLQVQGSSSDISRDLGSALVAALDSPKGTLIGAAQIAAGGPRLQDVLDTSAPLVVVVHDGFDYWIDGVEEADQSDPEVAESMERANATVVPTVRLVSVEAAYWAGMNERATLRWVLPEDEEPLLDALARMHVAGTLSLGDGTRFIGTFRAHGLLVPVWDLPSDQRADDVEDPASAFRERLDEALAVTTPLTGAERHARSGLQTRQLTIR